MTVERNLFGLLAHRVQESQRPRSIDDDDPLPARIVSDIIRVAGEVARRNRREASAIENLRAAIARGRDKNSIGGGVEVDTLRLSQIGDPVNPLAGTDVQHLEGAVSER